MEKTIILILLFLITIILRIKFKDESMADELNQAQKNEFINNFLDRNKDNMNFTCMEPVKNDKSICVSLYPTRKCVQDNSQCFIDASDIVEAEKYAYRKLCQKKGHCLGIYEDGTESCEFTKETCLASSQNPKQFSNEFKNSQLVPDDGTVLTSEERDAINARFIYDKFYWIEGKGCINGSQTGIANFENYCKTKHACNMGEWNWDPKQLKCTIKNRYCDLLGMDKEGGGCTQDLGSGILEGLFGKTLMRGDCPPYKDIWGKKSPDEHEDIMDKHCFIHLSH